MDDFFEQLEDPESATQKIFEETYSLLNTKGLSQAEIMEMADKAPELTQRAIQECKSAGKISTSTLETLLPYAQKLSRISLKLNKLQTF